MQTVFEVVVSVPGPSPGHRDTEEVCQHVSEMCVAEAVERSGNPLLSGAVVGGLCKGIAVAVGLPKLVRIWPTGSWHYPAESVCGESEKCGPSFGTLAKFVTGYGESK